MCGMSGHQSIHQRRSQNYTYTGKLALTDSGYQYICVMIDYVTKWPQAYPLRSKSAEEVTNCIIKFFYQFKAPKRILTDQGREFVNQINQNVSKILGIKRSLCSPYHPQTNGLVERMNGTIQRALSKLVSKKPKQWDKHRDAIMFGLRTKKQMTTKLSPFLMMFGGEARYPSEVPEDYQFDSSVEAVMGIEQMTEGVLKLDEVLQTALTHTAQVPKKMIWNEQKAKKVKFCVGNKVWRCNVRSQQRKGGKLDPKFLGPFTIKNIEGKNADLIDERGVIFPKINFDHLRLYTEEMPCIPHKIVSGKSTAATASPKKRPAAASPVSASGYVPSSPTVSKVAASLVSTSGYVPSSPTVSKVATSPVSTSGSVPSSPTVSKVSASPVSTSGYVPSSPTVSKVATSPVSTSGYVPSSPTVSKVSALPVSTSGYVPSSPTVSKVSASPVSTSGYVPSSPTVSKVAASPVSTSGSVPSSHTVSKVSASPVSTSGYVASSPTVSKVAASPVSTSRSVPSSPTVSKVAASSVSVSGYVLSSPTTPSKAVQHQLIKKLFKRHGQEKMSVLLSRIGPYKIFFADINKTAPNNELESEVINAYMCLLVKSFNAQSKEQAFQIDSFEITNIWNGQKSKLKVDPTMYKYLIGIVNDHHHWTLVVMLPSKRRALFLDPLGESSAKQKQCQNVTRWSCNTLPHPKQQDGTSCGVFALKFAECVLREEPIVFLNTPEGVEETRKAIAVTVLQNSDDLSNLCHVCGEESGDIDWISCDSCSRWYHQSCVRGTSKVHFLCYAC